MAEQERIPRGKGEKIGSAKHVLGGGSEVVAEVVFLGSAGYLVDLGEPVALFVLEALDKLRPQPREAGGVRSPQPLEAAAPRASTPS